METNQLITKAIESKKFTLVVECSVFIWKIVKFFLKSELIMLTWVAYNNVSI